MTRVTDSWPTLGLRSTWKVPLAVQVFDNRGMSLPNGVSSQGDGVMRWYTPLETDAVSVKVNVLNRHSYTEPRSAKMRVLLAANIELTSYLAAEFEATANGVHTDTIRLCIGSSPTAVGYQGSPITHVVADGDSYTVTYDDATKALSVYKDTDTTPLVSWPDTEHLVPHGPGHRYVGLSFSNTADTDGLQVTSWEASDA